MNPTQYGESSSASLAAEGKKARLDINLPTSMIILPAVAGTLGLFIGMSRGGRRARLRFLAENAHRMPDTIQGQVSHSPSTSLLLSHPTFFLSLLWKRTDRLQYFYNKTRNYRMMQSAGSLGLKYALALGGGTMAYCFLDESIGRVREDYIGVKRRNEGGVQGVEDVWGRNSWRRGETAWSDGALAGGVLGSAVTVLCESPCSPRHSESLYSQVGICILYHHPEL
jgi:hypothetical protein